MNTLSVKIKKALLGATVVEGIQSVRITLKHEDVTEMQNYCKANGLTLHKPEEENNRYWFICRDAQNDHFVIEVVSNKYKIVTTYKAV